MSGAALNAHLAFAIYDDASGNLIQGSSTFATTNTSDEIFTVTFSTPPVLVIDTAYDICLTSDSTTASIQTFADNSGFWSSLIDAGAVKGVFAAGNLSTGTTTLTFPATIGTRTSVTASLFAIVFNH